MASILSLIAGLVVGAIAGWLLRGRQIARTQPAEAHVPAQSTGSAQPAEDSEKVPALVGATSGNAAADAPAAVVAEPAVAEPAVAEPIAVEPVSKPAVAAPSVAEPAAVASADPVERAEFEPAAPEPVATEPIPAEPAPAELVEAEPVPAEPVAAEPVAAEPVAAEPAGTEPVAVQTVAEPDDLTKIAGIGPKMAMALAASGITTFEQLAATALPDIRAAVAAAGMRLAPSAPTWPEQAKALARITN